MTERSPDAALSTRLTRVAAFVAIVWTLAASFVAFDLAVLTGSGILLDTSGGRALALSATVRNSKTCIAETGAASREHARRDAPATAWVLGVMAGMHAVTSKWEDEHTTGESQLPQWRTLASERTARAARNIEKLARHLQVPEPGRFTAQQRADAIAAFMTAVEADTAGTARGIAEKHSETACHLYKLGAYWGYASELRIAVPGQRSIFGPEIEHHARRAALPEELWAPALAATPSTATTEERAAQMQQLTVAITGHLESSPPTR